jgi:hypothetical protein
VIHIHGDLDDVFPIKYINECTIVKGGTHIMILSKYKWLNDHLPYYFELKITKKQVIED